MITLINNYSFNLVCCFCCLALPLKGQPSTEFNPEQIIDSTTVFENYTIDDGLASNQVFDVLQDRFGYMWFATAAGLSRFDGSDFVNFSHHSAHPNSLSDSHITCLTEDSNGNLWIGTKSGLNRLNRKDYSFRRYKSDHYDPNSIPGNHIRALMSDTAGIVWLETANGFLSKFDTKKEVFTSFGHQPITQPYPNHSINKTKDGNLIILGRSIQPTYFDIESGKLTYFSPNCLDQVKSGMMDADFFEDAAGNFWMANSGGPLFLVDKDRQDCTLINSLTSIYDIFQAADGQLWMGGWRTGAIALDLKKSQITKYPYSVNNPKSLVDNHVLKIFEDKQGNIWFATAGGVSKLSPKQSINHIKNEKGSNQITALVPQSDTVLWVGTSNDGLYRFNPVSRKFTGHWTTPFLASKAISCMYLDEEGLLWIGLWAGVGFQVFNTKTKTIELHQICSSNTNSDWFNDMIQTSNGDMLIGAWGAGPLQFLKEEKTFSERSLAPVYKVKSPMRSFELVGDKIYNLETPNYISVYDFEKRKYPFHLFAPKETPNCNSRFVEYSKRVTTPWINELNMKLNLDLIGDKVWFALPSGLFVLDTMTLAITEAPLQVPGDTILDLIASPNGEKVYLISKEQLYETTIPDIAKGAFVSTPMKKRLESTGKPNLQIEGEDVFIFDKETLLIYNTSAKTFRELNFKANGIKEVKVSPQFIWVVTGAKLEVIARKTLQPVNVEFEHAYFNLIRNINTVAVSSAEQYWVGTDLGLFQIDLSTQEVTPFFHDPEDPSSLPSDQILALKKNPFNTLWIATSKGLCQFLEGSQRFERHNQNAKDGLASRHTTCILEDSKGNYWFGSSQGILDWYNPTSIEFKYYENQAWNPHSLQPGRLDNTIHCLYEDRQGRIWIGGGALSLFREESQDFAHFRPKNDNPFNSILSIIEDDGGKLWLGTDRGLYIFDPDLEIFSPLGLGDNIQALEFTRATCRLSSGELAIGGVNGFNLIKTNENEKASFNPDILVFRFKAGQDLYIENIQNENIPKLRYKHRNIELDIAVMDLTRGNKIKYKLRNYDRDWTVRAAKDRTLIYNNLPAGDFTLEVYAGDHMGNWSTEPKTIHFSIAPHWRDTWICWLLTGFILGFIGYKLFKWQQKKQIEEKEKALRLKFLEVKSLQSQMNPHFVFNVLGSMQNLILKREPREANRNLVRLSTLIRRFLESTASINMPKQISFYNSEIPLEEEEELIRMYIEFEQLQYRDNFLYDLSIDDRINKANFMIPPMIIQPYIENAIKHGLLYKEDGAGLLNIKFNLLEEDIIECIIEDNGVGRKKAQEIQENSVKRYKSLGTQLVHERVNILNQLGYSIKINTIDRPKGGTIVSIKIDRNYDD